jgi:hypothetical protein
MPDEPPGAANVIRVQVCRDNVTGRITTHGFGKRVMPDTAACSRVDARIGMRSQTMPLATTIASPLFGDASNSY